MLMSNSLKRISLVEDKVSDFKIEVSRIKSEFKEAFDSILEFSIDSAKESGDNFSLNLYTDIDRSINYFRKSGNFKDLIDNLNRLIEIYNLDLSLKINKSYNEDIDTFLNIFISEYGISKFYKDTIDQVLFEFDSMMNLDRDKIKSPGDKIQTERPISSNMIPVFDLEEDEEHDEDKEDEEGKGDKEDADKNLSRDDINHIEEEVEKFSSIDPFADIISDTDARYSGSYFLRKFIFISSIRNTRRELFAAISSDNKWIVTKSGRFIIAKDEFAAESKVSRYAFSTSDATPSFFRSWVDIGGSPKRAFYGSIPSIGAPDKDSEKQALLAYNLNYSSTFYLRNEVPLSREFEVADLAARKSGGGAKDSLKLLDGLYRKVSSAEGAKLPIESQSDIIYIDDQKDKLKISFNKVLAERFNNFIAQKLDEINKSMQDAFNIAKSSSTLKSIDEDDTPNSIKILESKRYLLAKELDNIVSTCIIRDNILKKYYEELKINLLFDPKYSTNNFETKYEQDFEVATIDNMLITRSLANQNTIIGSILLQATTFICFSRTLYIQSFAAGMTKGFSLSAGKIYENEGMISNAFDFFQKEVKTNLSRKISLFFDPINAKNNGDLFCRYISQSIQLESLYKNAFNHSVKAVRLGWNYISCPTCSKLIYYSKYKEMPAGIGTDLVPLISSGLNITTEQASAFIDPSELSDYDEDRYSFFRERDGSLITTKDLVVFSREIGKDWNQILNMISSNDEAQHKNGIKERQDLLRQMGARPIKKSRGSSVFAYKTKCPFPSGRIPESMLKGLNENKKGRFIEDFSCGLSLNINDILSSDRKIEPFEMHSAPFDPSVDAEVKLNEALDLSIEKGILSEEDRAGFINELKMRRSGGWKNSNTMFRCPCKPNADESNVLKNKSSSNIHSVNYIAHPMSGFWLKEYSAAHSEGGFIYPPTNEIGDLHSIEDYTSSYFICGSLTSISSFCRDTTDRNSVYGILKEKLESSLNDYNIDSQRYISNFIETLLQLGVDFNDLLPFVEKAYNDIYKNPISLAHTNIIKSMIKVAINELDMGRSSHDRYMDSTRTDTLGDLKLVCNNGHRFKIVDSINFGKTHTGFALRKGPSKFNIESRIKRINNTLGYDNLRQTLNLGVARKGGLPYLTMVSKNDIKDGMIDFRQFDGINKDFNLSNYYYVDNDNNYYIFNEANTKPIWGEWSRDTSVSPYIKRDQKTKLFVSANPLIDGKISSTDDEEAINSIDSRQVEKFSETITKIRESGDSNLEYDKVEVDTDTANERVRLDLYYSPLAVTLQSALFSIKDFCDRATSTEILAPLHGRPVTLKNDDDVRRQAKYVINELYRKYIEDSKIETSEDDLNEVVSSAESFFSREYIEKIKVQDLRFLNMLESNISPIGKSYISRMIIHSLSVSIKNYIFDIKDISLKLFDFDKELSDKLNDEILYGNINSGIDKIVDLIKSNIEKPKETALKGLVGGDERLMISNLQGSEYMGRVLMLSCALYMSESISRLYRRYLRPESKEYIGVNIGLDLSDPKFIIRNAPDISGSLFGFADNDIRSIPTSFPFEQLFNGIDIEDLGLEEDQIKDYNDIDKYNKEIIDQQQTLKDNISKKQIELRLAAKKRDRVAEQQIQKTISRLEKLLEDLKNQREEFSEIIGNFIEDRRYSFEQFLAEMKYEMAVMGTACTNYNFTERSVYLIRESLKVKYDIKKDLDRNSKKVLNTIINRCITNSPITTMSLVPGDKYHSYYSGDLAYKRGGPYRVLPLFGADTVKIKGTPEGSYPIFSLSSTDNSYANLGVQINQNPGINNIIVLYKDITSDEIQPYPTNLPEAVILSGWKTGIVNKSSKKINRSYTKEISLFYHPYTLAIFKDGSIRPPTISDDIVGFKNEHINYNSAIGFNFGPLAAKSGITSRYPVPYAHMDDKDNGGSHIGLLIPMAYKKDEGVRQSYIKIAPFFDAKIPIEIPTDSPGGTIKVDITDFLVRDPPEKALDILTRISKRYIKYKNDALNAKSDDIVRLREECIRDTSELFRMYRNLPYRVTNTVSSSALEGASSGVMSSSETISSIKAETTPYIPMADFVTCFKLINLEEFSPEFGGHRLWSHGDNTSAAVIKGALERMIIDVYGLEYLADSMNDLLKDDKIKISPIDLMDPHNGVFDKIYQKVKENRFSFLTREEAGDEKAILEECRSLIAYVTGYKVGDDYIPISSIINNEGRRRTSWENRLDTFLPRENDSLDVSKKFAKWIRATGRHYMVSGERNNDDAPSARIKIMTEIFPFNSEDGTGRVDRLTRIQNPDSEDIVKQGDLNYSSVLYGVQHTISPIYYYGHHDDKGDDEEELVPPEEYLKKLQNEESKKAISISAVKYASGISEFFIRNIIIALSQRIKLEKKRLDLQDIKSEAKPISKKASKIKNSIIRVRVAPHDSVAIMRMSEMTSLLSMFVKIGE